MTSGGEGAHWIESAGYVAAIAVEEMERLARHDLGVSVLHGFHLAVHDALVLSFSIDGVHLRNEGALCQTRIEDVLGSYKAE